MQIQSERTFPRTSTLQAVLSAFRWHLESPNKCGLLLSRTPSSNGKTEDLTRVSGPQVMTPITILLPCWMKQPYKRAQSSYYLCLFIAVEHCVLLHRQCMKSVFLVYRSEPLHSKFIEVLTYSAHRSHHNIILDTNRKLKNVFSYHSLHGKRIIRTEP